MVPLKKKSFQDLECPNPVKQSLFFDWLHYFLPFEPGRTVNAAEEEKGGMTSELQLCFESWLWLSLLNMQVEDKLNKSLNITSHKFIQST